MTPVFIGVAALVAVSAVTLFLAGGMRRWRQWRLRRAKRRRTAKMRKHAESREPSLIGSDSEEALGAPAGEAGEILNDARRAAAEITTAANHSASAIVSEAEEKAREIVAAADLTRGRLEQEMAHERNLVDEKRRQLSELLVNLLAQVQWNSGDGSTNLRTLAEIREEQGNRAGGAE